MKKIIYVLVILLLHAYLFSNEIIKFNDIKSVIPNLSKEEIKQFFDKIKNKRLERETGWILSTEGFDSTTDIVYVEMDKPNKNLELNKPDLYFIIDKKISKRLGEYQLIYFNALIKDYDFSTGLVEITDVYLSGVMR